MASHAPATRARRHATVRTLVLALVVALLPMTVAAPAASAMTTTEATWAHAVLSLLNHERALHGLPALTSDYRLVNSAHAHNLKMAAYNTMSHQLPGEPWLGTRISRAGYSWTYIGENIGWNSEITQSGVTALESLMYNERAPYDGHRLNILSSGFRNIGIDVYIDSTHHKVWLTEDFGHH
jgi:uncharacterized protein YkwD